MGNNPEIAYAGVDPVSRRKKEEAGKFSVEKKTLVFEFYTPEQKSDYQTLKTF